MSADDRLLLSLLFVDRLEGKAVAQVLGIHAGNVTRRKQQALESLRGRLGLAAADSPSYGDCLDHLMQGPRKREFAEVLISALEAATPRGQDP
jgi:hypothetical protein